MLAFSFARFRKNLLLDLSAKGLGVIMGELMGQKADGQGNFYRRVAKRKDRVRSQVYCDWLGISEAESETQGIMPIKQLVAVLAGAYDWNSGVELENLKLSWKNAVGDFLASQTELVSLRDGIARVRVLQPSVRFHLLEWKPVILEKLRNELKGLAIRDLMIQYG